MSNWDLLRQGNGYTADLHPSNRDVVEQTQAQEDAESPAEEDAEKDDVEPGDINLP